MNNKSLSFIRNFSYTLSSNLIALGVSAFVALIVPKYLGVEEYGYFQLYVFYSSYAGLMHFGWNDGIYLRYGGSNYNELNKNLFSSQFYMLVLFQLLISFIICILTMAIVVNTNKIFVFSMVALNILVLNVLTMLLFIMQATNRIKEYATSTFIMKVFYFIFVVGTLILGIRNYKVLIICDIIGKGFALIYAIYCCSDLVIKRFSSFYFTIGETMLNISSGIKLMFANIAGMLIIGVVRFGIERAWDVKTFGKVSLTLNISKMIMLFINSVGIIMFPILRKTKEDMLPNIYLILRDFLMVTLLGILIFQYPMKKVLYFWLPQYAESLNYMALLFPMSVFEGKMALLINTYFKTLRKEKLMLKVNLVSLILSIIGTLITTMYFNNLNLAIGLIVTLLAFRCVLAENMLSKILKVSVYKDITLEIGMTIIFITTGWFLDGLLGGSLYFIAYLTYLLVKRKDILNTARRLKELMKV